MQKIKQALRGYFQDNIILYSIIIIFFLIGMVLGVFMVNVLQDQQVVELKEYLDLFFFGLDQENIIDQSMIIRNAITQNIRIISLLWILGITMVGIPATLLLLGLKGFTLGFTFNFLFSQFSFGGLLFAFGAVIPHNIIIIPALLTAGVASLAFSVLQIQSKIKKRKFNFWNNLLNYTSLFIILLIFILIGCLIEAYITSVFIHFAVSII